VAVKVVRQPTKIALLGAPTSAAAMSAGHEKAPGALRSAGLIDRLRAIGYEVADMGDDPVQLFAQDDESPRARNVSRVLKSLEAQQIPSGPVNSIAEVFADPQVVARAMRIDLPAPYAAGASIPAIRTPIVFSAAPLALSRPAPRLGEHTAEVLQELAGR